MPENLQSNELTQQTHGLRLSGSSEPERGVCRDSDRPLLRSPQIMSLDPSHLSPHTGQHWTYYVKYHYYILELNSEDQPKQHKIPSACILCSFNLTVVSLLCKLLYQCLLYKDIKCQMLNKTISKYRNVFLFSPVELCSEWSVMWVCCIVSMEIADTRYWGGRWLTDWQEDQRRANQARIAEDGEGREGKERHVDTCERRQGERLCRD